MSLRTHLDEWIGLHGSWWDRRLPLAFILGGLWIQLVWSALFLIISSKGGSRDFAEGYAFAAVGAPVFCGGFWLHILGVTGPSGLGDVAEKSSLLIGLGWPIYGFFSGLLARGFMTTSTLQHKIGLLALAIYSGPLLPFSPLLFGYPAALFLPVAGFLWLFSKSKTAEN